MGPPQCLAELERQEGQAGAPPRLVWGDTGEHGGAAARAGWRFERGRESSWLAGLQPPRTSTTHLPASPARPQRAA